MYAARRCSELVFVGFSCPDEDIDIVEGIGDALKENPFFRLGQLLPVVVEVPGPHRDATRSRFERALGTPVDYREVGFGGWVESLQ